MDFILRNSSVFWVMNDKIPSAVKSLTGHNNEKAQCAGFISIKGPKIVMYTMFMLIVSSDVLLDLPSSLPRQCVSKSGQNQIPQHIQISGFLVQCLHFLSFFNKHFFVIRSKEEFSHKVCIFLKVQCVKMFREESSPDSASHI